MNKKFPFRWLFLPATALVFFGLAELASQFPNTTEKWYSQTIYPFFARLLSRVSSSVTISLDDLFYILLIALLLLGIVLLGFRKISLAKIAKTAINIFAGVYIMFLLLWGFNYHRQDLNHRLALKERKPDTKEFVKQFEKLIGVTSRSRCSFESFDKNKIDVQVEAAYKKLAPVLKIDYPMGTRRAKKITFSGFFAKAGISGYFGPFFSEVHINSYNLPVEYPFVLAHEKAHQFGITSEAEANFYAWLVCSQSNSKQLQYSGNLYILRFFIYEAYQLKEFPELMAKLDKNIKADFSNIQNNWKMLRNEQIDRAASKVNDTYLKSNKVEKGIEDYQGVVKHVMDYSYDKAFQKKWKLKTK